MSIFKREIKISLESSIPTSEIQILQFINPFHEKYNSSKDEYVSKYFARNKIIRLFRSEPISKKLMGLETDNENLDDVKGESFTFCDNHVNLILTFPNISSVIKKSIPWLTEPLSKKSENDKISKHDFNVLMISIVLYTIKELGFGYMLVKSRCEEYIYVKIVGKEDLLREHADRMNYRLMFRMQGCWRKEFQRVPPFGPIWVADEKENEENRDFFVKYDSNGNEVTGEGSLFTFTDKYRITYNIISQKIDLQVLRNLNLLLTNFVPHEKIPLNQLKSDWASFKSILKPQPINSIKTYFSEQIAFYFCWMETYKNFMTIASIVGFLVFITKLLINYTNYHQLNLILDVSFCLFLAIWAITFEQYWVRKEKILAWEWGTLNFGEQQIQREDFKGKYCKDEASGRMKTLKSNQVKYDLIKIFSFSTILVFVALVIAFVVAVFMLRIFMLRDNELRDWAALATAVIYAVQINIFDLIYTLVAKYLTIWENHETVNEYNNSFALKLFMFRFINTYSGLIYTAFFKEAFEGKCGSEGCLSQLGFQLSIIFVVNIVLNTVELGLPLFLYKFREIKENLKIKRQNSPSPQDPLEIEKESKFEPYDHAIEDYMEMCLQYGFVVIFGASFPLITLLALIEIFIEIRIDAIKLCTLLRRPEPVKTEDIGIWKKIILFITLFGIFSNAGIIIITSELLDEYEIRDKFTIFVIFEHIILLLVVGLRYLIPDTPEVVIKGSLWAKRILVEKIAGKNEKGKLETLVGELDSVKKLRFTKLLIKDYESKED